jgi:hypothetical protein
MDRTVRPRRAADRWLLVVLIALTCVFAAALMRYVFLPAATGVATSSATSWSSSAP